MAWRIFSIFVGVCSYCAVEAGVARPGVPGIAFVLGTLGALFIAIAIGSYVGSLPRQRREATAGRAVVDHG